MVNTLVYFTVFLVILTILLLIIGSFKGMMQSKSNIKKMLLKTFPILICIAPCIVILGVSMYNMLLMMFGSSTTIQISAELEELCCTVGTWISGILIAFGVLVLLTGSILKLIKRRRIT